MDTEPLVREAPVEPAPPPAAPPRPPEPVRVTPPPPVRIVETPSPPPLPKLVPAEIARTLAPVGALEVVEQTLMGMAFYTACGSRLASAVVAHAAFRTLTFLAETPAAGPVTQTTLRGAAGALVVTPLGPRPGTGPALAVALPQRGALALLEILALRVAAEYRAAHSLETPPPASAGAAAGALQSAPVPARVGALVRSLASGTSLQPVCLRDATGGLTVHLLLEPGANAERLARLAGSLYRIVEAGAEPGGIGPVQSIAVRLGSQRILVQPVTAAGGAAALLVAATDHRPGLTRLQLERVAARLGGSPS
jgi:predicted regulator of Ras-like GTPase activity (Roadblock/LC7/MglB family)